MSEVQKRDLHLRIEMIVDSCRHEESFMIMDKQKLSKGIIDYLEKENLSVKEASVFEVQY